MDLHTRITSPRHALDILVAGDALFTIMSSRTGARFTFKVSAKMDDVRLQEKEGRGYAGPWFARQMTGSDNESPSSYEYMGVIFSREGEFRLSPGKKGMDPALPGPTALRFTLDMLRSAVERGAQALPSQFEFWHHGRCARCGHTLTTPESILLGLGPECGEEAHRALKAQQRALKAAQKAASQAA